MIDRTLIFRITHMANIPWILRHGLHARSSNILDPQFRSIGHPDIIQRRQLVHVAVPPGGALNDYVPFYFCRRGVMLYNVHTGYQCERVPQEEIIYVVSSVEQLASIGATAVIFDRNATVNTAQQFTLAEAWKSALDWEAINSPDFRHDPARPERKNKQQAECLVHQQLPLNGVIGLVCLNTQIQQQLDATIAGCGVTLRTHVDPKYYFS
jgi:hypothetical protein